MPARTAKPICATLSFLEVIYNVEPHLYDWYHHELRNAFQRIQQKRSTPPVPAGYEYLSLIIGIDQAHEISHHNAMLVPQPRTGDYYCGEPGIVKVNRDASGNEAGLHRVLWS